MNNDNNNFFVKNLGAIIGVLVALVLSCTALYRVVIAIIAAIAGARIGWYLQYNKDEAKDKMKKFIDRL